MIQYNSFFIIFIAVAKEFLLQNNSKEFREILQNASMEILSITE